MKNLIIALLAAFVLQLFCATDVCARKEKKKVFLVGDSTVKNGKGRGDRGQWGWGSFLSEYLDADKAEVHNHAIGGRSSRTFITEGRWDVVLDSLQKGDYVLIQFGHNDGGEIFTSNRPRASLRGIGDEDTVGVVEETGKKETVYTYGAYLRKYVRDARAKGACPVLCTQIPRNRWTTEGVVMRDTAHVVWVRQVAAQEGVPCIDLHAVVADLYDEMGQEAVKEYFTDADWTHTSEKGARLNASVVAEQARHLPKCHLKKLVKK